MTGLLLLRNLLLLLLDVISAFLPPRGLHPPTSFACWLLSPGRASVNTRANHSLCDSAPLWAGLGVDQGYCPLKNISFDTSPVVASGLSSVS